MVIKILIADDQYLIQEGIKTILREETEMKIVGTASNGIEAIALAQKLQPNVMLLDLEMPQLNGIEVASHISQVLPKIKIIMLSSHKEQEYIAQALEAGASSYLLKDSFIEDLKQAIYSLSRGYSYMEARLLNQALHKIKVDNIVNAQNQAVPRKRFYIPARVATDHQYFDSETNSTTRHYQGISKATLAPIFDLSFSEDIESSNKLSASLSTISVAEKSQPHHSIRYRKKLILCFLAIASFLISMIIF